jgi:hypothetical protein
VGVALGVAVSTLGCRTSDQPHATLDDRPGAPATTELLADPAGSKLGTAAPAGSDAVSTTPPTTNPNEPAVRAVIDRYWRGYLKAVSDPPDPNNPDLVAVLDGEASARILGAVHKLQIDGQYIQAPPNSSFERLEESVSFDNRGIATVHECVVDDLALMDGHTRNVVDGVLTTDFFDSTVAYVPGLGWVITTRAVSQKDGRVPCDE